MKKMKLKPNDVVQRKKAVKKPANATRKKWGWKKGIKKPTAMKKVVKKINKTKANKKKDKTPRFYTAKFVEGLACEFFIQAVDAATETLCKVYYSKDRKGLEYRYYRSFRPV